MNPQTAKNIERNKKAMKRYIPLIKKYNKLKTRYDIPLLLRRDFINWRTRMRQVLIWNYHTFTDEMKLELLDAGILDKAEIKTERQRTQMRYNGDWFQYKY